MTKNRMAAAGGYIIIRADKETAQYTIVLDILKIYNIQTPLSEEFELFKKYN